MTTHARTRLSWLWAFVMLNILLADVFSFMNAGSLRGLLEGRAEDIVITPAFLLLAAVLTEIPLAMVVLAQWLPARACRWANLLVAAFTIAYVWGAGATSLPHYVFFAGVETLACLVIVRVAWRARAQAAAMASAALAPQAGW